MEAAPSKLLYCCCVTTLLLATLLPQDAHAQDAWGDRSFDTSSNMDADRSWGGGGWLGSTGSAQGWQLGVTAESTDAGVIIRQVNPNSAAARSNIYPGDVIVCVAGDQVGRVGNQIFELEKEITQHADSRGLVSMLVFDRRASMLRTVSVQLDMQRAGLSGTLAIRGGVVPRDAVVTVRLENASRPNYQVRNGEYSFRLPSYGVGDIPFELNYDPQYISSNDNYIVRARVTSGGRTVFSTQQPTYVITRGNPSNVRLDLTPATYNPGGGDYIQVGYPPSGAYEQQISTIYRRYLGRMPSSMELAALYRTPDIMARIQTLPNDLMATEEFFIQNGGNNLAWMRQVFNQVVGHAPTSSELDLWMRRFGELRYSRTELLSQLNMQARG